MDSLIQVIYVSTGRGEPGEEELARILTVARERNARLGVTGMLLYSDRTFFQVLEGEAAVVDELMSRIAGDERHSDIVTITREPIARRSFADWTMGFAALAPKDLHELVGSSEFFVAATCLDRIGPGRAKKLLAAFREGRWRSRLAGRAEHLPASAGSATLPLPGEFSFAFQPIVDATSGVVVSYEALIRGANREPAAHVLQRVPPGERHGFDEGARCVAVELAARLGLLCDLNLNFLPLSVESSQTSIVSTLETAQRCGIAASRIVLEILESEIIHDHDGFVGAVNAHRALGLRTAIDDFGAGYAGLTLLAELLPDVIKLDMGLVRDVHHNGPRQAVIRGVLRTCLDLGVDVIAEGVEKVDEYAWLRAEGISLFQGWLFGEPMFERLPGAVVPGSGATPG